MCLIVVASRLHPHLPLIVAANRDEQHARPATPMARLRDGSPRILGGQDLAAGGTWLAVNEHGVVAGLTNLIQLGGGDLTKRSRGQLPLTLAEESSAAPAAARVAARCRPLDFNPAWLVVADREALLTIDMTGGDEPRVLEHGPGLHVFENCPPGTESPKVVRVRTMLTGLEDVAPSRIGALLTTALADHDGVEPGWREASHDGAGGFLASRPACVHGDRGGTRWSGVVTVGAAGELPEVAYADGPPCQAPFVSAKSYWRANRREAPTNRRRRSPRSATAG